MENIKGLKTVYSILLDLQIPGLADQMKSLGSFEPAFEWWVENTLTTYIDMNYVNDELENAVDPVDCMALAVYIQQNVLKGSDGDCFADRQLNKFRSL